MLRGAVACMSVQKPDEGLSRLWNGLGQGGFAGQEAIIAAVRDAPGS